MGDNRGMTEQLYATNDQRPLPTYTKQSSCYRFICANERCRWTGDRYFDQPSPDNCPQCHGAIRRTHINERESYQHNPREARQLLRMYKRDGDE